jgi:hypothetical protein
VSVARLAFLSAGLVSSSALYQAFGTGSMPVSTAMTRFGVVLVISWIALSVVAELAFSQQPGRPQPVLHDDAPGEADDVDGQPSPVPPTSTPNP